MTFSGSLMGSATAICTPASRMRVHSGERVSAREPMPSTMARQTTPRRAARISASATSVPVWSSSQM